MNRELKRVPLDFNWELDKVWKGYINPYKSTPCQKCNGTGYNEATRKLSEEWFTHTRKDGKEGWMYHLEETEINALFNANNGILYPFKEGYIPTPEELNNRTKFEIFPLGVLSREVCIRTRAKSLGIYEVCDYCKGEGHIWQSDKIKKLSEEWEEENPAEGEGFQLWETTTEGSPISPVFDNLKDLAKWCAKNTTIFADKKLTKREWLKILKYEEYRNELNWYAWI